MSRARKINTPHQLFLEYFRILSGNILMGHAHVFDFCRWLSDCVQGRRISATTWSCAKFKVTSGVSLGHPRHRASGDPHAH
jgi:hypothetical protein